MTWSIVAGLILTLGLLTAPALSHAQNAEPPRFQPPRPPSMDQEFEEAEDEDVIDQPGKAPPPPPMPGGSLTPAESPAIDLRAFGAKSPSADPSKLHFKVVEGAFYEKGKPRGRTQK
jgi:hypothetical protein